MKKKKRILRTVISTMLMCCMLVGDLGSVFATSVGSSVVSEQTSEEQGTGQDLQTLSEPDKELNKGMQSEQSSSELETPVVEEPKVEVSPEVKPEVEIPVEPPEVTPDVIPEPTPEAEPEKPEVRPESEKPVEEPEVKPELEEKPVEKPSDSVPSEQPEDNAPAEEPVEPSVETTTSSETDNWSLDLVFYDSTVDGGKTPLKEINWDASDGGYKDSHSRTITVQINYKNTNAVRTYQPGEVKITLPILHEYEYYDQNKDNFTISYIVGANDSTHTGYDWSYIEKDSDEIKGNDSFEFTNSTTFEKNTNFEGSIQIKYNMTSYGERNPEEYFDYCEKRYSKELACTLTDSNLITSSESISFEYYRRYDHAWVPEEYNYNVRYVKLGSADKIDVNVNDYYWLDFIQYGKEKSNVSYQGPVVDLSNLKVSCDFSESCVVYDNKRNRLSYLNGFYTANGSTYGDKTCFIVGFPKNVFNEESNNLITNLNFKLYGKYSNKEEYSLQEEIKLSVDLRKFEFSYPDDLYKIGMDAVAGYGNNGQRLNLRYQDIVSDNGSYYDDFGARIEDVNATYLGSPMTVQFGVDLLYATDNNNHIIKLIDDDYYVKEISFNNITNGSGDKIDFTKYDCELWVRYANESNYTLYSKISDKLTFAIDNSKKVVGYYALFKDLEESIVDWGPYCKIEFCKKDIPRTGDVQVMCYQNIFHKNNEGILLLQNEPGIESYVGALTKEIAEYDKSTYGHYTQRAVGNVSWEFYDASMGFNLGSDVVLGSVTQDEKKEEFRLSIEPVIEFSRGNYYNEVYKDTYSENDMIYGFVSYLLLPKGVNIVSSKEDIVNSMFTNSNLVTNSKYCKFYSKDFSIIAYEDVLKNIKKSSTVKITENWKNTGRTRIEIKSDFKDNPFYFHPDSVTNTYDILYVPIRLSIPYESVLSLGNVFKFINFTNYTTQPLGDKSYSGVAQSNVVQDDGMKDKDTIDIDEDGKTTNTLVCSEKECVINTIFSAHQDVQTSVQTDKSNYSTGLVKASPESEYSYKLRARSGSNQVSNLVLINNLEEGYGDNEHWKGEFSGIDTSFAENRTYRVYKPSDPRADAEGYVQERVQVKPYYSTSTTEGELYQTEEKVITDPSGEQIVQRVRVVDEHGNFVKNPNWLEYSDSVDRGTVKSLAFEFLDAETGEQAILPENNLIYVEIKMKAPVEADGLTADGKAKYAYNNCFTQWNALDNMGQPVDFITGINSNTVKVTVNDRVSVQINKVWEDEENKYNTRPDTIEFVMKKDGKEVDRQTLEKGKTTVTFSGLLVDELSTYTFEEVCPSGYTTEGVIYDKVADTYTATNTLDPSSLVEVKGTKTWVGDLESERPESITVNLYRNDEKIDSKVVRASDGWSYDFGKFVKNDPNGNEYVYRVEEEPIEGYKASYGSAENGLNITFNSQCKTESDRYDYVEIYYKGSDDKTYKLGKWGGTALAGKVVGVPSKDFWLYWRTDSSSCNYYGFSIDSIESASVEATGTVATLPNYAVEEVSGSTYPDSAFDGHTHGNYGNSVNKVWHYTTGVSGFNITNTSNMIDINGTKYWSGEGLKPVSSREILDSMRPESITVNLLQDGKQFMSTTTDKSKEWKYSFRVPKLDENGREYKYSVREEPVEGYIDSYYEGNGSRITFSNESRTESVSYDYVEIYYEKDGKMYKAGRWGGTTIAGASVTIPAKDFYLYWKTDSSVNNYYGYSVDSVVGVECSEVVGTVATIPDIGVVDTSSVEDLQSEHTPYLSNDTKLFKYWGNWLSRYDIENTLNLTEISGTKHWEGDTEATRPESITVNLLQNGTKIDSTTTDASKGWKYSFTVPKFDDTGRDYEYSVSEEPVDGYEASYYSGNGNGSMITFSADSRTEGASYDYVEIYYEKDGKMYKAGKWGGTTIAGTRVTIPSRDFYLYWKTDSSGNNYYGYRVESVVGVDCSDIIGTVATLPNYTVNDVQSINKLQSGHNPYLNNEHKLMLYHGSTVGRYDITNTLDNIELRFDKVFNMGTSDSLMGLQHDGISFTLYENTLESGYPEAYPGTSDEWRKVGELTKYEVGGKYPEQFLNEYYIDGLKSNKEYFLVENVDNLMVNYYGFPDTDITVEYNVSTESIEDSCYVVRTGLGTIDNIFLTVYGYSDGTEYKPLYQEDFQDFYDYYGGYTEGTNLHSFLDYMSSKYPTIPSYKLVDSLQPMGFEGEWMIPNVLESKRIGVTKKIKASDINFDNGNPTFIFEARVPRYAGYDLKSVESGLNDDLDVLDIKHVEFTKEYVEANTDAEGYVSKTVYFDRIVPLSAMVVAERVGSRYDCSSVTVDGLGVSAIMSGMGHAEVFNIPFIETNITFTNEKYENQYYSHNDIVVNEIKRNKTSSMCKPH